MERRGSCWSESCGRFRVRSAHERERPALLLTCLRIPSRSRCTESVCDAITKAHAPVVELLSAMRRLCAVCARSTLRFRTRNDVVCDWCMISSAHATRDCAFISFQRRFHLCCSAVAQRVTRSVPRRGLRQSGCPGCSAVQAFPRRVRRGQGRGRCEPTRHNCIAAASQGPLFARSVPAQQPYTLH